MTEQPTFGNLLQDLRTSHGISPGQFVRTMELHGYGINTDGYNDIEGNLSVPGQETPSSLHMAAFLKAFGESVGLPAPSLDTESNEGPEVFLTTVLTHPDEYPQLAELIHAGLRAVASQFFGPELGAMASFDLRLGRRSAAVSLPSDEHPTERAIRNP